MKTPQMLLTMKNILKERYFIFEPHWKWVNDENWIIILVRKDGAGLVHVNRYKDGSMSISDLFVQPESRRKGIGHQLLTDAEEIARQHNAADVFLWVNPSGWHRAWYHRRGYRIIPHAEPTPAGDIYMHKDLTE